MNNDRIYYSHEAETRAQQAMTRLTILLLMVGLGLGAALALLFAPASGQKLRKELAKTFEEGLQNGREVVEPLVKHLGKDIAELQKTVEEGVKNL